MSYSHLLESISTYICSLDEKGISGFNSSITIETISNLKVYQRNLFGNVSKILGEDFEVTRKYVGERNFQYLIRTFILREQGLPRCSFLMKEMFVEFIEESYEIHQDMLLEYIVKIDFIWSGESDVEVTLPKGVFTYWDRINQEVNCEDLEINFNLTEKYLFSIKDNEKIFRVY